MALAFATVVETTHRVTETRRPQPVRAPAPAPRAEEEGGLEAMDDLVAAVGEMLRSRRTEVADALTERLRERGIDATVCAFLSDDLREIVDGLADIEVFFQESLEALSADEPSPRVLMERASDVSTLDRLDRLHLTFSNLRRRMVQVAAGARRVDAQRR